KPHQADVRRNLKNALLAARQSQEASTQVIQHPINQPPSLHPHPPEQVRAVHFLGLANTIPEPKSRYRQ
ncbi:hypothetical protein V1979_39205, partial [Pseudomonas aeruginosa]